MFPNLDLMSLRHGKKCQIKLAVALNLSQLSLPTAWPTLLLENRCQDLTCALLRLKSSMIQILKIVILKTISKEQKFMETSNCLKSLKRKDQLLQLLQGNNQLQKIQRITHQKCIVAAPKRSKLLAKKMLKLTPAALIRVNNKQMNRRRKLKKLILNKARLILKQMRLALLINKNKEALVQILTVPNTKPKSNSLQTQTPASKKQLSCSNILYKQQAQKANGQLKATRTTSINKNLY